MKYIPIVALFFSFFTFAEIDKKAYTCDESGKMCFLWWPKLQGVDGWKQDMQHSNHYKMNTQAPLGSTFSNAETVIYARAEYQHDGSPDKNLSEFIKSSQEKYLIPDPTLMVEKTKTISSQNNINFESYKFIPSKQGNWEQVSYAEEIDKDGNKYFLIFVLSSRSQAGYDKYIKDYFKFITQYK